MYSAQQEAISPLVKKENPSFTSWLLSYLPNPFKKNDMASKASLLSLPEDLLVLLLSYLTLKELGRLSSVNKKLFRVSENNKFWQEKALRDLPSRELTKAEIIMLPDADRELGLRKKYYRNTLFLNELVKFKQPYWPSKPDYSPWEQVAISASTLFTFPVLAEGAVCLAYTGVCCVNCVITPAESTAPLCCAGFLLSPCCVCKVAALTGVGLGCLFCIVGSSYSAYDAACGPWHQYPLELEAYQKALTLHDKVLENLGLNFNYSKQIAEENKEDQEPVQLQRLGM